jgi:hypothetical protein
MCESDNVGESSVFSRAACIFTHRAYFTYAACIFTRFEDYNALARIKPALNTLETINESSEKFHHGNAPHTDAYELNRFLARTPSLAGGF